MKRKNTNAQENASNFSMQIDLNTAPIFDEYILNEDTTPDTETDEIVESMNSLEDWLCNNEKEGE